MVPICTEKKLLDILPHGSGIDGKWYISIAKNGNIQCRNYFHAMNENGYYDGLMPFILFIYREKSDRFKKLHGLMTGKVQVLCRKGDVDFYVRCDDKRRKSFYDLKNYLTDTFYYALTSILAIRNELIDDTTNNLKTGEKYVA